jgi:SAM-dependent methyltransferase
MSEFNYVGSELELFAAVRNWKSYWSRQIRPFIAGDVIEVGAGIGSNTPFLDPGGNERWVCLEPDPLLLAQLTETLKQTTDGRRYETVCGTLQTLDAVQQFDTIIYIDVLEHIENDREELNIAAGRLRPSGRIIVLSPAHQWLFTPFDSAIGHFRRYNHSMLRRISPTGLRLEQLIYLDSAGLTASAANLFLLRQSMPTKVQLQFWDRWMVPISRVLDKLLLYSVGKSIVAVWRNSQTK